MLLPALPIVLLIMIAVGLVRWWRKASELVVVTDPLRFGAIKADYLHLARWLFGLVLAFYALVGSLGGEAIRSHLLFRAGVVMSLIAAVLAMILFISMNEILDRLVHEQPFPWTRKRFHDVIGYGAAVLLWLSVLFLIIAWIKSLPAR